MAYGLKPVRIKGPYEIVKKVMKSNTTITKYDPVHLEDDTADLAATAEAIYGVAMETQTNATGGTTQIEILVGADIVYKADSDEDTNTFGASGYGGGKTFQITGTTGAVQVDVSTAGEPTGTGVASAQIVCVDESPEPSDTSIGLFKIYSTANVG